MRKDNTYFKELEQLLHEHDLKALYLNAVSQKDAEQQLLVLAASVRKKNPALFASFKTPDEYAHLTEILKDIEKVIQKTVPRSSREQKETTPSYEGEGTFQQHFKELVKTQGADASCEHTARYLLEKMSGPQVQNLKQSLDSKGVHNQEDFNRLLSTWKDEALRTHSPHKQRSLAVSPDKGFYR